MSLLFEQDSFSIKFMTEGRRIHTKTVLGQSAIENLIQISESLLTTQDYGLMAFVF